jgi:hypothetical protein
MNDSAHISLICSSESLVFFESKRIFRRNSSTLSNHPTGGPYAAAFMRKRMGSKDHVNSLKRQRICRQIHRRKSALYACLRYSKQFHASCFFQPTEFVQSSRGGDCEACAGMRMQGELFSAHHHPTAAIESIACHQLARGSTYSPTVRDQRISSRRLTETLRFLDTIKPSSEIQIQCTGRLSQD